MSGKSFKRKFSKFSKASEADPSSTPAAADGETKEYQFQLGVDKKRVSVRKFHGRKLIDIREYYQKNDQWLPGSKGISLTEEQWLTLVTKASEINKALELLDGKVPAESVEAEEGEKGDDDDDDEGVEFEDVDIKPVVKKVKKDSE